MKHGLDAIRMSCGLMSGWRGDHSALVLLVAEQLGATNLEVAAEAATVLGTCHVIAQPARQALAAQFAAQLAQHGSQVWAAPRPQLRRAHQKAVLALARLGDTRALPSLLVALDSGVDAWLAIQVAGSLPPAAEQLVPRLCDHLRRVDLADQWQETSANANLHALAKLGDPAALAAITEALVQAARHERWRPVCSALEALGALGPAAAPALDAIRSQSAVEEFWVRPMAVAALWVVSGDREEVMPLLLDMLNGYAARAAADVLAGMGPFDRRRAAAPAASADGQLRVGPRPLRRRALGDRRRARGTSCPGHAAAGVDGELGDRQPCRGLPDTDGSCREAVTATAACTARPPQAQRPLREHRQRRKAATGHRRADRGLRRLDQLQVAA